MDTVEDPRIKKMLTSVLAMYEDYVFFTAPTYADFDSDSAAYEDDFKDLLTAKRNEHLAGNTISAADALNELKN